MAAKIPSAIAGTPKEYKDCPFAYNTIENLTKCLYLRRSNSNRYFIAQTIPYII